LQTLRHGGAEPVAMTTERKDHESFAAFRLGAAAVFRVPLLRRTRVERIIGARAVEAVDLRDLDSGKVQRLDCDLVVFTGDWIPDHELARLAGIEIDPGTQGPRVDPQMRTDRAGIFAVGNLLHGAETADVAALSGGRVAAGVVAHLQGTAWPSATRIAIACEPPLSWIVPAAIDADELRRPRATKTHFHIRAVTDHALARLELRQGETVLARKTVRQIGPARSARIGDDWLARIDPAGGPLSVRMVAARPGRGR
jgi:pyruvate/2-oxoglutarate dehydrogenase complex dihydrolipoamide dehydrogenase (E3) component